MSTHYIEEAERLADTVTIMSEGRAIVTGRPTDLVAEHAGREVLEVYGPPPRLAEVEQTPCRRRACERVARARASRSWGSRTRTASSTTDARRPANLEDVFVLLTGEDIE